MPKKKQVRNAFFLFMLDYKARCEKNGERFPNGLIDVQEQAGLEWQNMSAERKRPFELQAKAEKESAKGDNSRKQTSLHNSYLFIDKRKMEEEQLKEDMNTFFKNKFYSLSSEKKLAEQTWYLIHVNYFCVSEWGIYHPAEIAMCEFSLGSGVMNVFHIIMEAIIPLGYMGDAIKMSESCHHIPTDRNGGEKDIYKVSSGIKKFLQPGVNANGGECPPIFTMEDNLCLNHNMTATKSLFHCLANNDEPFFDQILVYPLDKFFMELKDSSCRLTRTAAFPSITVAKDELERDTFKWSPEIACEFHLGDDRVEYCSKSYVQRWVFTICDHCCGDLDISIIKGRHVPMNADVNFKRRAKEEEQRRDPNMKAFTIVDHSKLQQKPSSSHWPAKEEAPRPNPQAQGHQFSSEISAWPTPFDQSKESFPEMSSVRGRGRSVRGFNRGGPISFADAMRNGK